MGRRRKKCTSLVERIKTVSDRFLGTNLNIVGLPFGRGVRIADKFILRRRSAKDDHSWYIDKRCVQDLSLIEALRWINSEISRC